MARFRKTAALLACAVMAASVSGCSDTRYSVKYGDGEEVKAGVYIGYLQNELTNQIYMFSYQGVTGDYFDQQVDGVSLSEYVKNNALKDTKEYVAIKKQFEEEGLSFTDDEKKDISTGVKNSWDSLGELYENNGVSKDSLKEIYREQLMRTKLFNAYYDEGGKEAPTDEELQQYVNDNYLRYKMIAVYKSSATDEETKNAENEEKLALRDEYFEKGKDLTFEEFDQLIEEYREATAENEEEETPEEPTSDESEAAEDESSEETTDESSEPAADESSDADSADSDDETVEVSYESEPVEINAEGESSEAVTSASDNDSEEELVTADPDDPDAAVEAPADAESSETGDDESAEAPESSAEQSDDEAAEAPETTGATDDESTDASSADESADGSEDDSSAEPTDISDVEIEDVTEDEAPDPYENEAMVDIGGYDDDYFETESGKLFKAVKDAEVGKVFTFENENGYYIIIKGDVSERTDYVEENRYSLVQSAKDDEFQSKLDAWVEAANIVVNDKAIKRYTPEVIYDRMNEYYENSAE